MDAVGIAGDFHGVAGECQFGGSVAARVIERKSALERGGNAAVDDGGRKIENGGAWGWQGAG